MLERDWPAPGTVDHNDGSASDGDGSDGPQALIVCGVCLVVEVWIAARFPGPTTLANAVVTAVEGGLAWLARVMYGWLTITPARLRAARVVRWVPILLFVVAGVAMLAVIQLNSSVPWAMGSFYVMAVAAAAASVAGASR